VDATGKAWDCTVWSEALATCPGCTLQLVTSRYYDILADQIGDPLTEAEKAELASLWANVIAATTVLDKAYAEWLYAAAYARFQETDAAAAAAADAAKARYDQAVIDEANRIAALKVWWNAKIADYQGQLAQLEALLGTRDPRAGQVGAFWDANDRATEYNNNLNARLASTDGQAKVCTQHDNFGQCFDIPWGEHAHVTDLGIPNDSISCMTVYKGVKLTWFKDSHFGGASDFIDCALDYAFFNLPSGWSDEISSLICEPSFSDYYRKLDILVGAMNDAWGAVELRKEQIRSLARDIDLWINLQELLDLNLASRAGLITRIDAVVAYVDSLQRP
jgi:hypothetical protein